MKPIILGRSGLAVSPLCLGAMTLGDHGANAALGGLGVDSDASVRLLNAYLEKGGNFIDTADGYSAGESERIIGRALADSKTRDDVVIATKYTTSHGGSDPNKGGSGRKNAYRALEGSLKRLQTDYVDLYWVHFWDHVTPIEEVVQTMDALTRAGKIRYYGLSNAPAWYVSRLVTLAEQHNMAAPIALQMEYSLVERSIEREHFPMSRALNLGLCVYSPLAGGALSGKYKKTGVTEEGRLSKGLYGGLRRTERDGFWDLLAELEKIAGEVGGTVAQVALNWAQGGLPSTSIIIGATKPEQLDANMASLNFTLTPEQRGRLEALSMHELGTPYHFEYEPLRNFMLGAFPRR